MTTNQLANSSSVTPPPTAATKGPLFTHADALVTLYFRQSADGSTFNVTPVYLRPTDAAAAISRAPHEYGLTNSAFASWPGGYNNSAQPVGGRGRLLGAVGVAN